MRQEELISLGVKQYTERDYGNPFRAQKFAERVTQTMRDFGEGFAVFIGDRLGAFTGDVGSARNIARQEQANHGSDANVRIRKVKV